MEQILGGDDRETLSTRNNLASAYQAAGRTAEAITLHEQNLADRQRVLGADHPETLTTGNKLAEVYGAETHMSGQPAPVGKPTRPPLDP